MTQLTLSSTDRSALRPGYSPTDSPASASSIRVLIVEDEETLRESCASVLTHDGYDVAVSGVAREAQALLRQKVFDVLLLDWYMSDVPGAELLPLALAANPLTGVIAVPGKPTLASSLEAMRIGAWAYLPKPFSAVQLGILVGQAAHATLTARESLQRSQELEQQGENSDKIRILGLSPARGRECGSCRCSRPAAPAPASAAATRAPSASRAPPVRRGCRAARRRTASADMPTRRCASPRGSTRAPACRRPRRPAAAGLPPGRAAAARRRVRRSCTSPATTRRRPFAAATPAPRARRRSRRRHTRRASGRSRSSRAASLRPRR